MNKLNTYLGIVLFSWIILVAGCSMKNKPTAPESSPADVKHRVFSTMAVPCTAPDWDPDVSYAKGDTVAHIGHQWKAKRANQGVEPPSASMWTDLGPCGGSSGNTPPTVSITSPTNGANFSEGDDVTINADANDVDGSVTQVEFFQGATSLGIDSSSPYSVTWTNVSVGSYSLTAVATDDSSATTTSDPVSITVNPAGGSTDMQIFGVWHAGNHYCDWSVPRELGEFDQANHWLIDRGDGSGLPSVNLVILSFVQPMKVLNKTNDDITVNGVPIGMSQDVVDYFKNAGVRVMMSIGGVTYTDFWEEALAADATQFGLNAAEIATNFGVGIEIDYERATNPDIAGLQAFVDAYRSIHPYDATGTNHAARLTIDLAAGGRYLQDLNRYATINWLDNANPVLDYANAMVARASGSPTTWQEHVDGMPTYNPVIPPKAPNRFTGGLFLKGNLDNCTDFYASEQYEHADYVLSVPPNGAGTTSGMLGYMFWAAEYPSARKNYVGTVPPNTCEGGMGTAATYFEIPIPMPPLRQE